MKIVIVVNGEAPLPNENCVIGCTMTEEDFKKWAASTFDADPRMCQDPDVSIEVFAELAKHRGWTCFIQIL